MHKALFGVRLFGLTILAAIGIAAVTASAAQAAEFRINGSSLATNESVSGSVLLSKFEVWGISLRMQCEGGNLSGEIMPKGKVTLAVTLSGCTVVENKNCTIYEQEGGVGPGKVHSEGKGEVVLHGGLYYVEFASEAFNTVYIGGAKCTLPEEMVAGGSFAMELPEASTESTVHDYADITNATESLLGVSLACNTEAALVTGSTGHLQLSGAKAGSKWSVQ